MMETVSPAVHFDLSLHPTKDTIKLITSLLEKVISVNDALHNKPYDINGSSTASEKNYDITAHKPHSSYTCFHARSIPSISIQAYLSRILKYCPCANECFLAVLVYFDRMAKIELPARPAPLRIDSYNIHRFIITSVMVASKLFSDVFFTNTRYAKVGGLPVSELNVLEVEFLELNNYSLFVTVQEFQYYGDQLLQHSLKEHQDALDTVTLTDDEQKQYQEWQRQQAAVPPSQNHLVNGTSHAMDCDPPEPARTPTATTTLNHVSQAPSSMPSVPGPLASPAPALSSSLGSSTSPTPDHHRLFKRPSSQAFGDHPTSPRSNHKAATLSSSVSARQPEPKTLPTPPFVSPSSLHPPSTSDQG
ncbi:cyclin-domain-containing protein [Hesseltinella vesiculosa]|uniref:Cyclin-domain-containing protein n=1 Tax=Hesseltinella vesiculosa TaxID=101127 RepID=A0A1X2GC95_9FUNG|nr:cyclin-domain-containing protein [Hesseltinella vesiculosa]